MKLMEVSRPEHLNNQISRHKVRREITRLKDRSEHIKIIKSYPAIKSILCIGSRDESEVLDFIDAGYRCVGIDLFTDSGHIMEMDMHKMTFEEDEFDLIYASHVLEHSYDPVRILKKISKVAKVGLFAVFPRTKDLKKKHPLILDIMADTPEEFHGHKDFNDLGGYIVEHYGYNEAEIEVLFIFCHPSESENGSDF